MTIEKNVQGNTVERKLAVWLDTQTTRLLEAEVNALDADVTALTLDFTELEYISSAGLRQIVAAYKKMKGALTLRHVSDEIMNVISMTGRDKRMKFE